ncbi:hypothetical protein HPB49_018458 [Dermacentor silvarum]|uniref:Uncharacterized protein n=1 Tax=Dermacentor silvarum TaxID=543639 RepID=A0ACB8CYR9_DERSI|nr:hypothetical protein HPB49_018458 [Dermacentor silvarum]
MGLDNILGDFELHDGIMFALSDRYASAPPYSQAGYRDGKLYIDGVFGLVLEALADFVPFSYDIVYDHRLSFGVRLPNGSYTGIIGLLQSGAVDLAAAPVLVRYDRTEVATYAPVLFTSHCGLIAVAGEPAVWAVLLASIPVVSGALAFVEKRRPRTGGSFIWEMYENAWDILRSFTYEGHTAQTKSHGGRLLYSVWWLTVLVLTNGFAGQLKASMAIKTEPTRFRSADDVSQQPAIRPLIWKHTVYETYVRTSGRPSLLALTRQVHRHGGFVPIADMYSPAAMEQLYSGRAVIVSDRDVTMHMLAKQCRLTGGRLYVAPELLFTRFFTVAHSKHLPPELERRIHAKCVLVLALHI